MTAFFYETFNFFSVPQVQYVCFSYPFGPFHHEMLYKSELWWNRKDSNSNLLYSMVFFLFNTEDSYYIFRNFSLSKVWWLHIWRYQNNQFTGQLDPSHTVNKYFQKNCWICQRYNYGQYQEMFTLISTASTPVNKGERYVALD